MCQAGRIIALAKAGNERFGPGRQRHRDRLMEQQRTAAEQSPAASCSGAWTRGRGEIVFDLGLGAIFNCRVAGAVEGSDVLGA